MGERFRQWSWIPDFTWVVPLMIFFDCLSTGISAQSWNERNENEEYTARHECSFVQAGNKFYLMGGRENGRTIDVYDYASDTWETLTNSSPIEFNHFQATQYQGLIWVAGAFKDNDFPNEQPEENIWIFNPATREWIEGPLIPADRRRGSASLSVYNNKFYLSGGNTIGHNGGFVSWFDSFDPATGEWTPMGNIPRARDHFHSVVIGNKLYLAGGRLSGGTGGVFAPTIPQVDVYNFDAGTWSTLPAAQNIPTERAGAAAVNFNGNLVVIGGETPVSGPSLKTTESYNPGLGTWSTLPDMNSPRHGTQAIVSGNGIFITAGSPVQGGGNQRNMEVYGSDAPVGNPSVAGVLSAPSTVIFDTGGTESIGLELSGGNVAEYIRSMTITGEDASDFDISSGLLEDAIIVPGSSHTIGITLSGAGEDRSAVLTIAYGASSSLNVILSNPGNDGIDITNPGDQSGREGDAVSLAIVAEAANDLIYSTTGLPPGLTINASTGVISGIIEEGAATSGSPFAVTVTVTEDATEPASESIQFSWEITENQEPVSIPRASPLSGEAPLEVSFTGSDSTDDVAVTAYLWEFNDGSPDSAEADPEHIFALPGTYMVTLTVMDASGNTDSDSITIDVLPTANDPPVARIEADPVSGESPLEVIFTGSNSTDDVGVTSYFWDFKDGTTSGNPDPEHTFATPGNYEIELTVTDAGGLTDTASIGITVLEGGGGEPPSAHAEASTLRGNAPLEVNFTGSHSTDDNGISGYEWDFGDGGTSDTADPDYTYTTPGMYEVTLTVTDNDGLEDSDALTITVDDIATDTPPVAVITVDPDSGTAPLTVAFSSSGSSDDHGITGILWDFEDGTTSVESDPIHVFQTEGTYHVLLTVTDATGNSDSANAAITVGEASNESPVASIEASPTSGHVPLEVSFSGAQSMDDLGVVSYRWDFGNGDHSDEMDTVYRFTLAGDYTVTLTVADESGLTDTAAVGIHAEGVAGQRMAIITENPARSGFIYVRILNSAEDAVVRRFYLHDSGGRLLGSFNAGEQYHEDDASWEIPADALADGMYFVSIDLNKGDPIVLKVWVKN